MTSSSDPKGGGPGAARPGVYSRFIPREELSGFAAWQPGSFGDDPARKPQAAPDPAALQRAAEEAARREAQRRADAEAQAVADRIEEVRLAREGGYQDGYRDGTQAMEAFKVSCAAQTSAQVAAVIRQMQGQFEVIEQGLAERIGGIVLELARQVVRSELALRPESVIDVAQEALAALLLSARHVRLHLHPDDEALVAQGCAELIAAREVRLLPDPAVERGGCRVESDIGTIDAEVATRWQLAAAAMGRELPWHDAPVAAAGTPSGAAAGAETRKDA